MRRSPIRGAAVAAVLAAVLAAASGCGFANALAHPGAGTTTDPTATATAAPGATASPTPSGPRTVVQAELATTGGLEGTFTVTVGPVVTGLVLPFPQFFQDCPVSGPSLQYVPVTFTYSVGGADEDGLAGHLTVTPGPGSPPGLDVGVFFSPGGPDEQYCTDFPPFPSTDTFWSHGGPSRVTGYVVLDQAVTPEHPDGQAAVFDTLQARISDVRLRDVEGSERRLTAGTVQTGAVCADDPTAFCVPLG